MEYKELKTYLKKLYDEKKRIQKVLSKIEKNGVVNAREEIASELSFYDNHPADSGGQLYDIEKEMALRDNEKEILNKINEAITNIENGTYGKCKVCGEKIPTERLNFIPYAKHCRKCEEDVSNLKVFNSNGRVIEEKVIPNSFGYGYNDFNDKQTEFDSEDSYQAVEKFNRLENIDEYYDDDNEYVEEIEKISNQQYKDTLPK